MLSTHTWMDASSVSIEKIKQITKEIANEIELFSKNVEQLNETKIQIENFSNDFGKFFVFII